MSSTPAQYTFEIYNTTFNGLTVNGDSDTMETYPTGTNWSAPLTQQRSVYWDWRHLNPGAGQSGDQPVKLWNHTYTPIVVSGVTQKHAWKVSVRNPLAISAVNLKTRPPIVTMTRRGLQDISGPATGNVVNDTVDNVYCVAYRVNECFTGSAVGDVAVSASGAWIEFGGALVNSYKAFTPIVYSPESMAGWMIEAGTQVDDPNATNWRRITSGLTFLGQQYGYTSPRLIPQGNLALARPGWLNGIHPDPMVLKMPPPWVPDNVMRNQYVPVAVKLPSGSSSSTRVLFGYAENGVPTSFYCTSRQEACYTDAALLPFAYASDSLTPTDCSSGCTINVPGLSGRVMYFAVEQLQGGRWIRGQMQARRVQ